MTWTVYTDPVADLVSLATRGNTAAAVQLLELAARADDKHADPLLRWLGICIADWQRVDFHKDRARGAFGIGGKLQPDHTVRLLTVYKRLRGRGWTRERAVQRLAFYKGWSTRRVEQVIDGCTDEQDIAAELIIRMQRPKPTT